MISLNFSLSDFNYNFKKNDFVVVSGINKNARRFTANSTISKVDNYLGSIGNIVSLEDSSLTIYVLVKFYDERRTLHDFNVSFILPYIKNSYSPGDVVVYASGRFSFSKSNPSNLAGIVTNVTDDYVTVWWSRNNKNRYKWYDLLPLEYFLESTKVNIKERLERKYNEMYLGH